MCVRTCVCVCVFVHMCMWAYTETTLYRAPTLSLLLAPNGGLVHVWVREGKGGEGKRRRRRRIWGRMRLCKGMRMGKKEGGSEAEWFLELKPYWCVCVGTL